MNFEIAPKSTEIRANWNDARFYCFALNINGKTGWRLPTKEELAEIYSSQNDFSREWYWSSTEHCSTYAWFQSFNRRYYAVNPKFIGYYVRAIRDLNDN